MVTIMPVTVLVMIPLFSKLLPGQFHVIGPRAPVIALVGEEAVLSCQISPSMDAQNMEVRWYRNDPLGLVYHYGTSWNDMEELRPEYQGRTEFLKENITKGHVVLRIHPIQPSDGGDYACFFESSTYYNDAKFQVLVTVSGMAPHIHIEPGNSKDIKLTCTSMGWYPEPELQWRDHQGLHLAPVSEKKKIEEDGLFHVESSLTVDKSSRAKLSCVIRNLILNVEKEVHVSMAVLEAGKSKVKALADLVSESPLPGKLHEELGVEFARNYAENVTLDPETAHPYLKVAKDKKSVKSIAHFQELPKSSNRFDSLVSVLGQQIFSSNKHYWEVDVKNKMKWTVGICKHSVRRQGEITVSPETGFWTLCLKKCNDYQALTNPRITLHLEEPPEIIGIFLDYEAGRLSFYNVTNMTHIYTYKQKFTEALRPYFYPGPLYNGQNEQPLIIMTLRCTNKPQEEDVACD
ncbi:butyrophilin subfamily 1 member A1-like [Zalophus californianus]|uniref:Butyrophilin subfamily 1 member A1-like n=1 Tax=Zalophus californianus TaxID=9704 RepID=A0A6J2FAR2_ZALCA|nr:butyrophilin subfamily 1 member A1-like [Zalophus californianus]